MKNSLTRLHQKKNGAASKKKDELLSFYGVVRNDDDGSVAGALVMVCACFAGGIEKKLAYTFTNGEGKYLIRIPKLKDNNGLTSFKVRAGMVYTQTDGIK